MMMLLDKIDPRRIASAVTPVPLDRMVQLFASHIMEHHGPWNGERSGETIEDMEACLLRPREVGLRSKDRDPVWRD